LELERIVESF